MSNEYKNYLIENNNFCNKVIKPLGKGSVPVILRGLYTSESAAKEAIDAQESLPKTGVKKNAPTKNSNRAN